MPKIGLMLALSPVALRKESVDRNITGCQLPATEPPSLSARRAWIEIRIREQIENTLCQVALRKESVDRNCSFGLFGVDTVCRSPQGERG